MQKPSLTEKSACQSLALRLSWTTFWPTCLYGVIFVAPFTVILSFAGRGLLSTACILFMGAITWAFLMGFKSFYVRSAKGGDAKVFRESFVPLVLGRKPADDAWKKDGSPSISLIWPLLRERFTAFCFGALTGSIAIGIIREPLAAFLYLPFWFFADVYLLRQFFLRRLKHKREFSEPLVAPAEAFIKNRPRPGPLQFVQKVFIAPVLFAVLWWGGVPVVTGGLSFGPSGDVRAFMEEAVDASLEQNGAFALLGLGAGAGEDVHAVGTDIAKRLVKGELPEPSGYAPPQTMACAREPEQPLTQKELEALENYEALYAFEVFEWPRDLLKESGLAYIDFYMKDFSALSGQKTQALVRQALNGDREGALQGWTRHAAFLQRLLLKGRISLFEFMAVRKSHVAALLSLPCILAGDAGLAGKYADALQKAFGSLKPADIPMRQIVDNETRIMGWSAHKQVEVVFDDLRARAPAALPEIVMDLMRVSFRRGPDVLQTKLYWLMREMRQAIDESGGNIALIRERLDKLDERYTVRTGRLLLGVSDIIGPQVAAIVNIILNEMPKTYAEVFINADEYDLLRMLHAYAEAVRAGAWPEKTGEYLEGVTDPRLKTLTDEKAFVWDAEKRQICRPQEAAPEEDSHKTERAHLCLDTNPFVE